jgi:hypothetical protein
MDPGASAQPIRENEFDGGTIPDALLNPGG